MSDYVISDGELCHYGVKGMKWGRRKDRVQRDKDRLGKYKKKEISKIAKRRLKEVKGEAKAIDRTAKKYDSALDKYGKHKKTYKAAAKYIKTKSKALTKDNISKEEVRRVMRMKLDDMKAEKKVLAKAAVNRALVSLTTATMVSVLSGRPTGALVFENTARIKTNHRVDVATRAKIAEEAIKEASAEVYHHPSENYKYRR